MSGQLPFRKSLTQADMERMRLPRRYWECVRELISDESVGDKPSPKETASRYLSKIDEMMDRGIGLLLWGDNGRGKTSISAVVGKEARRRGYTVLYSECANLKRCVIERIVFDDDESMWERARSVDLLILDDLGKGVQDRTGFGARLLDELIRHRNAEKLATVITTNLDLDDLEDELKDSTMHSLKECIIPFRIRGRDRRDESRQNLLGLLSAEG